MSPDAQLRVIRRLTATGDTDALARLMDRFAMTMPKKVDRPFGTDDAPSLRGTPLWGGDGAGPIRLLSQRQREQLAALGVRMKVPARTIVYRENTRAESVFIITEGVLKSFRNLPSGKRPILGFLHPEDIFGLAEEGYYVNTTQSVTPLRAVRISVEVLQDAMAADPKLELQLLIKITHELREAQRHALLMGRRDAVGRLAMFLRSLSERAPAAQRSLVEVPMTRADIGAYLGLSINAVNRSAKRLQMSGLIEPQGRRIRILDHMQLERVASAS